MPNIKFCYLYRDASNYKKYGSVVFSNSESVDLIALETFIRARLIEETWFYNHQWQVPDLHFGTWDNELDHTWHEYECVEYTDEPSIAGYELQAFLEIITAIHNP